MHKNDKPRLPILAAVLQQGAAPFAPLALFVAGTDQRRTQPGFAAHADPRRNGRGRQNIVRRRGAR
jgi:hypothetical protein